MPTGIVLIPLVFLVQLFELSASYKILHVPIPAKSHVFSQYFIGRELIRRGHEVHLLTQWSIQIPQPWLDEANREGKMILHTYGSESVPKFDAVEAVTDLTMEIMEYNLGPDHLLVKMKDYNVMIERDLLVNADKLFETLDELNFDAVIVDSSFFIRYPVLVANRLRIPLITYFDAVEPWLVRMPWLPSVYSPLMGIEKKSNTFYDRGVNFLIEIVSNLVPPFQDPDEKVLAKYRQYGEFKDLKEIVSRSVLFLVPEDPVLDPVRPCTSNVVLVGGLSTEAIRDSKPTSLPQDYLDFIGSRFGESSESHATVVVSFGTMTPTYPERLSNIILEAFSQLPRYRFIWRFENYLNLTIPQNVKIVKWLAQKELLGHSSVKLFITHSGNNGQFESLYHGVPMLCVHLLADQPRNAMRIVDRGFGEKLDFRILDAEQLVALIQKIIQDPSYKERIMKASEIFRSRPDSPGQRAAFWIEHVIRFGGDHLVPAGNDLNIWQYLCLDVLFLLVFVVVVSIVLIAILLRYLFKIAMKFAYGRLNLTKKLN